MRNTKVDYILNPDSRKAKEKALIDIMSKRQVRDVRKFHESFSEYEITPLHDLDGLAKHLGVNKIWVKDESFRFGLNAFKVLGGSYAIGKYLGQKLEKDIKEVNFEMLSSKEIKEQLGDITFVTATDGNHGRGVAWAANQLGQKSVVYMPKGTSKIRLQHILREGSEASIINGNYDDAVRLAKKYAKENPNAIVLQDTAWEGYEEIPTWIMQGYATLADEALEQIQSTGHERPTHIFLQAGVGSFAGSILGFFASIHGEKRPISIIIEPDEAACIYKSAKAQDGKLHFVTGSMSTIMAGLACGEPNMLSWEILKDYADAFVSCSDNVAARGMRILASPLKGDPQIISGESGAVGIGLLSILMERDEFIDMREELMLDKNSKVLLISTEGDTDPENYKNIVWDGVYPIYWSK